MRKACECAIAYSGGPFVEARPVACQECGTACCRSCALEIGTRTLCRWCGTTQAAQV